MSIDRLILEELKNILHIVRRIDRELHPHHSRTTELKIVFGDNTMAATLPGSENVGQSVIATAVAYEADGITPTPGAVVSAQVWTVDNAAIASVTTNSDGTATFVGVAAGTATATCVATVTDTSGASTSFTATNTLVVSAPTGVSAGLQISFGTPTP